MRSLKGIIIKKFSSKILISYFYLNAPFPHKKNSKFDPNGDATAAKLSVTKRQVGQLEEQNGHGRMCVG